MKLNEHDLGSADTEHFLTSGVRSHFVIVRREQRILLTALGLQSMSFFLPLPSPVFLQTSL